MVTLALVEERERDGLEGEHGRGSYMDIGGGEHTVLSSRFLPPPHPLHHFLRAFLPLPPSQCACPSPAVAVPFGPGLTVGDL